MRQIWFPLIPLSIPLLTDYFFFSLSFKAFIVKTKCMVLFFKSKVFMFSKSKLYIFTQVRKKIKLTFNSAFIILSLIKILFFDNLLTFISLPLWESNNIIPEQSPTTSFSSYWLKLYITKLFSLMCVKK